MKIDLRYFNSAIAFLTHYFATHIRLIIVAVLSIAVLVMVYIVFQQGIFDDHGKIGEVPLR